MKTGHEYKKINPVICINLLDFILFPDSKEEQFHSCHMITDLDDPETVLTDHLRIHYLELPRIKAEPARVPSDRLCKWAYFFKEEGIVEEDEMKILIKDDPIFEQAHETFNKFTSDDELREIYEGRMKFKRDQAQFMSDAREEGHERGLEQGIVQGIEQGRKESNYSTATALKKDGILIDVIHRATGLSLEEIEKL